MKNVIDNFESILRKFNYSSSDYFIRSQKLSDDNDEIIVVAGPTGTGKSDIAIELARDVNGYIINADSRQIYKEINIGTATPIFEKSVLLGKDEITKCGITNGVLHFLYSFVSLTDNYSIYRYKNDFMKIIGFMKENYPEKKPILVGGTGLYIDSVIYNYKLENQDNNIDQQRRNNLMKLSLSELQKLAGDNIKSLNESDQKNPHRLIRFIEREGKEYEKGPALPHLYIVLAPDINLLQDRLKKRINVMIENGLLEEIELLQKKGIYNKMPSILGYKEFESFPIEKSLEQVKDEIFLHTRQFVKRQITWFKRKVENEE